MLLHQKYILKNLQHQIFFPGLRKFGRTPGGGDLKGGGGGPGGPPGRRKMYGSMSSLPSVSSIGSRHLYSKDKRRDDR